jgi:hypothetical protein
MKAVDSLTGRPCLPYMLVNRERMACICKNVLLAKREALFLLWWDHGLLAKRPVVYEMQKVENLCVLVHMTV